MKIILASPEASLLQAWKKYCSRFPEISFHEGSVFDVECDALVSPANSFGFMDGGIDAQYTEYFGGQVQERLRLSILQKHHGELLVGNAEFVATDHPTHPILIAAPTMRVPMALGVNSINPYLATRAVILAIKHRSTASDDTVTSNITSVCFPGMGTGVGRIPHELCARQMACAFDQTIRAKYRLPSSWSEASEEHQLLYTDKPVRLQF